LAIFKRMDFNMYKASGEGLMDNVAWSTRFSCYFIYGACYLIVQNNFSRVLFNSSFIICLALFSQMLIYIYRLKCEFLQKIFLKDLRMMNCTNNRKLMNMDVLLEHQYSDESFSSFLFNTAPNIFSLFNRDDELNLI